MRPGRQVIMAEILTRPENYTEHHKVVMSNCFHEIDETVAKLLKKKELFAQYSGWGFCGKVWWNRELKNWCCEIWRYRSHQETVKADSLKELMETVSNDYGWN